MLSIPEIVDELKADFEARGITASVEYGSWKVDYESKGNRVILGPGPYDFDAPGPPNAPGVQYINDAQTKAARSVYTIKQTVNVWVHGLPPDERDPKRSENAEKRTAFLRAQTVAALYRILHGSLLEVSGGQWPSPENQEFLFGSLTTFSFVVGIPVLDDEYDVIVPDPDVQVTETIAVMPSGELTVAITPEPTP